MNEFSLRKRMKELFDKIKPLGDLITTKKKDFINSTVVNRNKLTHPQKASESPTPEEMFALVSEMKYFLLICLLHEIGVPDQSIIEFFNRYKQFTFLKAHYFQ